MYKPFMVRSKADAMSDGDIVNLFSIEDGYQNIFQIGCLSDRITIFSQQHRALNLVWALHSSKDLAEKDITVVGAGFAGLVAASALKVLGFERQLKVFDKSGLPLYFQRGNQSRYVQPYMYDWPIEGSTYPKTELPYLNWYSGEAGLVVETVISQWNQLKLKVTKTPTVRKVLSGRRPTIVFSDGSTCQSDILILTVGLGLEEGVSTNKSISYWSNDSLNQSHLGKKVPASVLVSGSGDGGLIDTTRAAIYNFNHQDFIRNIVTDPDIINTIADFEDRVEQQKKFIQELYDPAETAFSENVDWNSVRFPKGFMTRLKGAVRKDTIVYFNASQGWFLNDKTSKFNRLIVAALMQNKSIRFLPGKLATERWWCGNEWNVVISEGEKLIQHLQFDVLVVRHGTRKECPSLFDSTVWKRTCDKWDKLSSDMTSHMHYPKFYLLDNFSSFKGEQEYEIVYVLNSQTDYDNLKSRIKMLPDEVLKQVDVNSFDIKNKPEYHPRLYSPPDSPLASATVFGLRLSTTSKKSLLSVLEEVKDAYYLFGIKISKDKFEEIPTEVMPYIPYVFPGPAVNLSISAGDKIKWIRVIQAHKNYPLQDAHNLLDSTSMLEIVRKKWSDERKIEVGWRLTAKTEINWSTFTHF